MNSLKCFVINDVLLNYVESSIALSTANFSHLNHNIIQHVYGAISNNFVIVVSARNCLSSTLDFGFVMQMSKANRGKGYYLLYSDLFSHSNFFKILSGDPLSLFYLTVLVLFWYQATSTSSLSQPSRLS